MFDKFWQAYPVKKGKKYCKQIWEREGLDEMTEQILEHIQMMLTQDKLWKRQFGIPHPSTYLNQGRWTDEPEIEVEREQQLRVPRDDTQLTSFAQQNGLPSPGSGQSYVEYRRNLERHIANSGVH